MPALLRWSAWSGGGRSACGVPGSIGLRVPADDYRRYFAVRGIVQVWLPSEDGRRRVDVNPKTSFWEGTCHELIHVEFKRWIVSRTTVPWELGQPPVVLVRHLRGRRFEVVELEDG